MKNLLQMFSYIILHTGCMSIKLQTYDHSISACWVWGWLRVKRVVETALLLLYTPLKNPPSKILTKAISIWGTSRYLLSKGGGTHGFYGGRAGENQLSPTEYKGTRPKSSLPGDQSLSKMFSTEVSVLLCKCYIWQHITVSFFFSNLQSFLGLVSLEVSDPMETYFMHASPPSPPPSPHDLLHHSSKQLKSLELLVIKNVFKMIHTLNYLQS